MSGAIFTINEQGWMPQARHCPSPNYNQRPKGIAIDLLVIHAISLPAGQYGGDDILHLFQNTLDCSQHSAYQSLKGLAVSSHFLIRRDGELIQFVSTDARAWHAGVSVFEGRENGNDFSIGIELEGCDEEAFTEAQYTMLIQLTEGIRARYPKIALDRIVGHCDVAPGRKTDPGPHFDWQRYYNALSAG